MGVKRDESGEKFYHCPQCGKKLLRIDSESVVYNTPVYCTRCKMERYPCIYKGQEISEGEVFAPFPS